MPLIALALTLLLGCVAASGCKEQQGARQTAQRPGKSPGQLAHPEPAARSTQAEPLSIDADDATGIAPRARDDSVPAAPGRLAIIPLVGPEAPGLLGRAALSPCGKRAAVAGLDGVAAIVDLRRDRVSHALRGHSGAVRDIAFSPGGETVVTAGADGTVRLWESSSGRALRLLRRSGQPLRAIAVTKDIVAVAGEGPAVELLPLEQSAGAESRRKITTESEWVRALAFSPDGRLLASGGHDGVISLWEPESGRLAGRLPGHRQWIEAVAFSPDGSRLASGSHDRRVRLWDVATGEQLHELRGHVRTVSSLAFSPDGELLASSSLDRTALVWEASGGRLRHRLAGHRWMVSSVDFDPAGGFLLSSSSDGTLRLWPLPLPEPAVTAPLPPPAADEVTLRNNTTGERVRLRLLDPAGGVLPQARQELAHFLRSGADDASRLPEPELVKLLDRIAARFGRQREIIVISGFRSPRYNALRTSQSRQVARESLHLSGAAIDLRVEGVTIMALRDFARSLGAGGVGFYPDSNFVHIDIGAVRYWSGE